MNQACYDSPVLAVLFLIEGKGWQIYRLNVLKLDCKLGQTLQNSYTVPVL